MNRAKLDSLVTSGIIKSVAILKVAVNDGNYGVIYADRLEITFPNGETLSIESGGDHSESDSWLEVR
jgi:hypothetical protein